MVQENDGLSVEEKQLFHGTRCSVIDAICKKGFDWRVCGKHGVAYGHGIKQFHLGLFLLIRNAKLEKRYRK